MGPSPLQIILVIVIALLLFGAGRIAELWEILQRRRGHGQPARGALAPPRSDPAPPRSDPAPPRSESEPT
jgi:hypothetical protein